LDEVQSLKDHEFEFGFVNMQQVSDFPKGPKQKKTTTFLLGWP
jgi:hypothetical protein